MSVQDFNQSPRKMSDSRLIINHGLLEDIYSHASSTFPEECCGLLIGTFEDNNATKKPSRTKAMKNVFESGERHHRYTIDPKEYMTCEIEAEKMGEEIVGIYHSHPNAPAKPSLFDQNHAWPTLSYLVVEVREKKPINVASWILKDDRSEFVQEELIVNKSTLSMEE